MTPLKILALVGTEAAARLVPTPLIIAYSGFGDWFLNEFFGAIVIIGSYVVWFIVCASLLISGRKARRERKKEEEDGF